MGNLIYIIAATLVIIWTFGYFVAGYKVGLYRIFPRNTLQPVRWPALPFKGVRGTRAGW